MASLALTALCTWPQVLTPDVVGIGSKSAGNLFTSVGQVLLPLAEWGAPHLPLLNYPDGIEPVVAGYPQLALARLLTTVARPVAAMNLSILLHAALGGYCAFRLALRVLGERSPGPALAAALLFQASAPVLAPLASGQEANVGFAYVCLAAEGAWLAIARGRPLGLLLLALGTALSFWSTPYLVMAGLVGAVPTAIVALRRRPGPAAVAALVTLAVVGLGYAWYLPTAAGGERADLCPAQVERSIAPERAVAPAATLSAVLGGPPPLGPVEHVADPVRMILPARSVPGRPVDGGWLGLGVLGLALLAAWRRVAGSGLLIVSAVLPVVLAMGPYLVLGGWVPVVDGAPLALPLHLLQQLPGVGPVFHKVQVPVRLLAGAALPLCIAAGLGLRTLGPRAAAALTVLVLAESLLLGTARLPWSQKDLSPSEAWVALAEQPDDRAVVETPPVGWVPRTQDEPFPFEYLRWSTFGTVRHGHPAPAGACGVQQPYNDSAWDSSLRRTLEALALGEVPPGALADAGRELRARGYGWWVLQTGTGHLDPAAEARMLDAARAELLLVHQGADGSWLFRLPQ